jgi:hypothetical protein
MSLEKAIIHGKEHRKQYRGSKRFDCSCRNHGSCGYWNLPDPSDATDAAYDKGLKQIDVDPWDFETRRELDV